MKTKLVISHISNWLKEYADKSKMNGFVVGVSGGIDSAVTSTLCALTGKEVHVVEMPIYQAASQVSRGQEHINWLIRNFENVKSQHVELTATFDSFMGAVPKIAEEETLNLSLANTRARLRMMTLYYFAGLHRLLVAGTGNKVEDFGVGFYTKYGDGGVDLSPIADLTKTEVYEVARELGIAVSIMKAKPTDGLWGDDRSDEDQIGASYPELEWAMHTIENGQWAMDNWQSVSGKLSDPKFTDRQKRVLEIYVKRHLANKHKMEPIPVCIVPAELK